MTKSYAIHLIAPSGYCQNQPAAELAVERLSQNHRVMNTEVIPRRAQRFAGSDPQRLADINQLAKLDTLPDLILAVRGGYGASRLLADIDYLGLQQRLAGQKVAICGHSDFTALQLSLLAKSGLVTFSGPMLASNFGAASLSAFTLEHFWGVLTQESYQINWQDSQELTGVWQGQLWGGNLAMICSLVGTPWMPKIEQGILVIEDINEQPFRIERMLLQLYYAGVLSQQQAIVTGSFTDSATSDYDAGYSLDSVWDYLRQKTGVPIINHLDFGHEQKTVTLPIGATAKLSAQQKQRQLTVSGYPVIGA